MKNFVKSVSLKSNESFVSVHTDCTCSSPFKESLFLFSFNSFLAASDLFPKVVLVSKEIKVNWHDQENVIIVFEGIQIVEYCR